MKVNLCEGCIEMLEEYYPYLIPKEELDIRTVNVLDCDNMFLDIDYGPEEEENDEDPMSLEEMLDILCIEDGDEEEFLSKVKDLFFSFIEEKRKKGVLKTMSEKNCKSCGSYSCRCDKGDCTISNKESKSPPKEKK